MDLFYNPTNWTLYLLFIYLLFFLKILFHTYSSVRVRVFGCQKTVCGTWFCPSIMCDPGMEHKVPHLAVSSLPFN